MKRRVSKGNLTLTGIAVTLACWCGLNALPGHATPPQEVELRCDTGYCEPEESTLVAEGGLAVETALETVRTLEQPPKTWMESTFSLPKRVALGMVVRFLGVSAGMSSAAPPTGVLPYPVQPELDVAWSLQGLSDDEGQGGEGAVEEYGG